MKLKVYVIDFEIPRRVKTWGLRLGIPVVLLLGSGTIASASGLFTWIQGQTLNASDLNNNFTYLQGEITTLQDAGTTVQAAVAAVTASSAVAVEATAVVDVPNTTFVNLPFSKLDWDVLGEYNSSTGFTPQYTGIYQVCASVYWSASVISELDVFVNGGRFRAMGYGSNAPSCGGCVDVSLTAGQHATVAAYQASGATQTVTVNTAWTYINVHREY